jgi:hypothetical protein
VVLAWVLALPPLREDGAVMSGRPIDQWQVNAKFSSERDCDRARQKKVDQLYRGGGTAEVTQQIVLRLTSAKCVTEDKIAKPAASPSATPANH